MENNNSFSLFQRKFFRYGTYMLMALLIIFMFGKIDFFISPIKSFIYSIIFPLLFGGLLYYILRPLVRFIEKAKIPHILAIVLSFAIVLVAFALLSSYTGSIIKTQFDEFGQILPGLYDKAQKTVGNLLNSKVLSYFNIPEIQGLNLTEKISGYVENLTGSLGQGTINFIGTITNIGSIIIIIPVILFYFLNDGHKFSDNIVRFVPVSHKKNVRKILSDIDFILSNYIAGQLIAAFFIGLLMYIGYLIIGLKYSLILAIFAMITRFIPFFGPWIGIVPAILLSLASDPFMVVKIFIVMAVVQQIDNNFISPQVMKKSMDIHPLTVILLLMGIIPILGFVGLLVIIPLYSAIKITIKNIIEMYYPEYAKVLAPDKPEHIEKTKKTWNISLPKKK